MKRLVLIICVILAGCSQSSVHEVEQSKKIDIKAALVSGKFKVAQNASALFLEVIKDGKIPVKASFNFSSGTLDINSDKNLATLVVDMTSWNSGLTNRDFHVKTVFFQTTQKQNETMTIFINPVSKKAIEDLRINKKVMYVPLKGFISIRDKKIPFVTTVNAGFTDQGRLFVDIFDPITIKISELGLSENLSKLMVICGHKSVDDGVVVKGHFEFEI